MISCLHKILVNNKIVDVLDLGAGCGTESLYCASFGANVDWVDKREAPGYLKDHPYIKTAKINIEDFKFAKQYDLVILKFVIHFLKQEFIVGTLFPNIIKSLRQGGFLLIVTFREGDKNFLVPEKSVFFSKKEFEKSLQPLILKDYKEYNRKDNHFPLGEHEHDIQVIVFQNE